MSLMPRGESTSCSGAVSVAGQDQPKLDRRAALRSLRGGKAPPDDLSGNPVFAEPAQERRHAVEEMIVAHQPPARTSAL